MKSRLRTVVAATVVTLTGAGAWAQFPSGGGTSGSGTGTGVKKSLPANGNAGTTKKPHHANGQTTGATTAHNSSTTTPTTDFAQELSHIASLAAFLVDEFGLTFETPQEKARFIGHVVRLYYTGQDTNGGASNTTWNHQHTGQ